MKPGEITAFFEKRFRRIRKLYNRVMEDFHPDDIHDFRLEIKRLRAFIRFLNTDISKHLVIGKKLKNFYHITGNIRNLQIHQQRVVLYSSEWQKALPVQYLEALHQEEERQRKNAREYAGRISFKKMRKQNMSDLPVQFDAESRERYIQQQQDAFLRILALAVMSDEDLHKIRKLIKDLLYNWKYTIPYVLAFFPGTDVRNKMKMMEVMLGNFHDLCVALNFFATDYTIRVETEEEKRVLTTLELYISAESEKSKAEIISSLKSVSDEMRATF